MKPYQFILNAFSLLFAAQAGAQNPETFVMQPLPLELATNKTSHLIFPHSIITVDRGSKDVLAQKATGVNNILQVKAAKENFDQSNLTVVTSDGKLYSFIVDYEPDPLNLNIKLAKEPSDQEGILTDQNENDAKLMELALLVEKQPSSLPIARETKNKTALTLNGIYVTGDWMFLKIKLANQTSIRYDIGSLKLLVIDRKQAKRSALQQIEIKPVLILGNTPSIAPNSVVEQVVAISKLTIPDKQLLNIQLNEQSGGRHLSIRVKGKRLLDAEPLNL